MMEMWPLMSQAHHFWFKAGEEDREWIWHYWNGAYEKMVEDFCQNEVEVKFALCDLDPNQSCETRIEYRQSGCEVENIKCD